MVQDNNRRMKDSGIPWIGMIPSDWEVCFTKQLMRNKSIKGFPDEQVLSLYRDYGVVPKNSRDDNHNVTSEDTATYKLVEVGDFVINKMKAWQGSMAISAYRGIISPAYYICRFTNESVNRRYIHYLLRNETYKTEYRRLSTGLRVGQWDLNIDDFLHIPAILPPLPTQQRIADFLDRKCAEIDELAALQETMIAELKRYKQSVITEAVTKGLDPNVPMKDSGVEWIGEIPEGWEVKRLKNLGYLYGGLTGKSGDDFNVDDESNCPYMLFIPFTNIFNNSVIDTGQLFKVRIEEGEVQNLVLKNDLLFLMSSEDYDGVGKPAIIEEQIDNLSLNSFCKGFRISNPTVCAKYLFYHISSHLIREFIRQEAKGFIRINLRQDKLACIPVFLPPLTEQRAIADYLDQKCAEIDELIAIKQQKIEALKEYKKSVIFEYVTGK